MWGEEMLKINTTPVSECSIGEERLRHSMEGARQSNGILGELNGLLREMAAVLASRFVFLKQNIWYDHRTGLLLPKFDSGRCLPYSLSEFEELASGETWQQDMDDLTWRIITDAECKAIFFGRTEHYPHESSRLWPKFTVNGQETVGKYLYTNRSFKARDIEGRGMGRSLFLPAARKSYCALEDGTLVEVSASHVKDVGIMQTQVAFLIPVCPLPKLANIKNKDLAAAAAFLELGFLPLKEKDGSPIVEEEKFEALSSTYKELKQDLCFGEISVSLKEGCELPMGSMTVPAEELQGILSNADMLRADLFPYPAEWLIDREKGSTVLFEALKEAGENAPKTSIQDTWYARDPREDIHPHGICAIDFGTKSTVVACLDQEKKLLRVGRSNLESAPSPKDYENPTAIELRNYIHKFLPAYESRHGRPFTRWEDVTVSYEAMNRLMETEDETIAGSVFFELKEWALRMGKNRDKMLPLRDQKGSEVKLFPYEALDPSDFDPIEIYAYYLGLYINNQWNGIYLNYILSFPADAEKTVKAHVLESFTRGLRQSLPHSLWEDEDVMANFRVYEGASEPAAYAVCALRELEKKGELSFGDAPLPFAVFDFGGGTTDFDYGLWRLPKETDPAGYNQVIEHISAESDSGLGGEKLLDLMAYEVYKNNLEEMREKNIPFVLPEGCRPFDGSELLLVENSLKALLNRRRIAHKLRPIWEEEDGWEYLGDDTLTMDFFDLAGNSCSVSLMIDTNQLRHILRERISIGVENFFCGLDHAFKDDSRECHILLAGNSSRSGLLQEIFQERLSERPHLRLHMPLGSSPMEGGWERMPTGKTGVVFGLLDARKSAGDVLVAGMEQDRLPYHLGKSDGAHFQLLIDRDTGNGWQPFCEVGEGDFDLYFTAQPRARSGTMPIEDVRRVSCPLVYHTGESGGIIYMRCDGQRLEYVVSAPEEITKGKYRSEIHTVSLEV